MQNLKYIFGCDNKISMKGNQSQGEIETNGILSKRDFATKMKIVVEESQIVRLQQIIPKKSYFHHVTKFKIERTKVPKQKCVLQ